MMKSRNTGEEQGRVTPAKIRKKSREKETYHMKRQKLLKVAGNAGRLQRQYHLRQFFHR